MPAFRQAIDLFVRDNLSPEANRQRLVRVAETAKQELIDTKRASTSYDTYVDGSRTKAVPQAQQRILYQFHYLSEAVAFVLAYLQNRAYPGGKFSHKYWGAFDDKYQSPETLDPLNAIGASEAVIGNIQPYLRKIDIQRSGNRQLHYTTPVGLMDDAVRAVKRRFAGVVTAKRVFDYNYQKKYQPKHNITFQSPAIILSIAR